MNDISIGKYGPINPECPVHLHGCHKRCPYYLRPRPPCPRRASAGEKIGEACPDCGHTNVVHPGSHNPSLDACVICTLLPQVDPS